MIRRCYDDQADASLGEPIRPERLVREPATPLAGGGPALAALPPFLRALLMTDGTVTKILEAYFWEPIEVRTDEQDFLIAERPIARIDVGADDRVLIRRARLCGGDSDTVYASACSVIRTELIPPCFRQRLIDREIGIGVLIRDSGLESYREVLEIGARTRDDGTTEAIYRTYRIIIDSHPVILITETFPLAVYTRD